MTNTQNTSRVNGSLSLLSYAQKTWFVSLLIAQFFFVMYLILGYAMAGVSSGMSSWSRFNETAYAQNDTVGNVMYALHVLLAIVMIIGGSLQLIPRIRQRFSRFHRINGRVFVVLACTISCAGLYLIIFRGTVGNTLMHSLTAFSGFVVLISSVLAVKSARRRDFKSHQVWAIRLFLAANGVLFFRLFIFGWFMVFGTLGVNTDNFTGPTVVTISFCSYVLPLLFAELVRYAQVAKARKTAICCAVVLFIVAAIYLVGLVGLIMGNWYPAIMG